MKRQKELFRHSLLQNRPTFVEYFLSAGFNPVTLLEGKTYLCYRKFLVDLYRESYKELVKVSASYFSKHFLIDQAFLCIEQQEVCCEIIWSCAS